MTSCFFFFAFTVESELIQRQHLVTQSWRAAGRPDEPLMILLLSTSELISAQYDWSFLWRLLNVLKASYSNSILSPSSGKTIQLHTPACLAVVILPDILCLIQTLNSYSFVFSQLQVQKGCTEKLALQDEYICKCLVSCGGFRVSFSIFKFLFI